MIKEQVSELSTLYHIILAQQGNQAVMQNIQQATEDFMVSTNNELQRDLEELSFQESADLGKMIAGYAFTLETLRAIEKGQSNPESIMKSSRYIKTSYKFYENKYIQELDYRNKQQREDYINSILLPLMMLIDFFKKL
tara:strand:+ start:30 stop:443 length:414 start_codon:yes stop_codon:yes gene_type:complete